MAENMIKFLRGNVASLPQTATAGAVYFTKDEGLYLGLEDGTYHRYGDFITVANVAALPSTGAHETCMYYCEAENILAKWDGAEWVQINKQKTLEQLGGVAKSVYEAKMALLETADSENATAIAGVDTRLQAAEKRLESVATTEGLGELTNRVTTAEGDIDKLEAAIGEGGSVTVAIAEAKKAGTDAQAAAEAAQTTADSKATLDEVKGLGYQTAEQVQAIANGKDEAIAAAQAKADSAYTLAEGKATMDQVNAAIAGAGHAVKAEVDTAIENLGKAYVAADEALETKLQGEIDKKVAQTAYDEKVAELAGAISAEESRAKGIEGGLETRLKAVEDDHLTAADKEDLQGQINLIMNNPDTKDVIDSIAEFTQYVADHGTIAEGFRTDIDLNKEDIADLKVVVGNEAEGENAATGLVKGVADNAKAIADEKTRAEGKEAELAQADIDNLAAAKKYTDDEIAELGIANYVKKADADAAYATVGHNHDDKYDKINAASEALEEAKSYVDGKDSAMNTRVEALEAIDHEHANKALLDTYTQTEANLADAVAKKHEHANKTVLDGITADKVSAWDSSEANAKAYADGLKTTIDAAYVAADSALKTELQGYADQAETDAVATAKAYSENLMQWGSF